jgi:hypothetical protein
MASRLTTRGRLVLVLGGLLATGLLGLLIFTLKGSDQNDPTPGPTTAPSANAHYTVPPITKQRLEQLQGFLEDGDRRTRAEAFAPDLQSSVETSLVPRHYVFDPKSFKQDDTTGNVFGTAKGDTYSFVLTYIDKDLTAPNALPRDYQPQGMWYIVTGCQLVAEACVTQ